MQEWEIENLFTPQPPSPSSTKEKGRNHLEIIRKNRGLGEKEKEGLEEGGGGGRAGKSKGGERKG